MKKIEKQKNAFSVMPNVQTNCRLKLPTRGITYTKQVANPRHQTPQGQSTVKLVTPL